MNKTLIVLILAIVVLSWNFIFTEDKKVEFTDQAKVLKSLSQSIPYKIAIIKYWKEKKTLPDAKTWLKEGEKIEIDISKSLIKSIEVGVYAPGAVTVYFKNRDTIELEHDIEGTKIVLIPEVKEGRLIWSCNGTMYKEYLPRKCQ